MLLYASSTVWLFVLSAGFLVVAHADCCERDWQRMIEELPEGLTYDPGTSTFVEDVELIFMPYEDAALKLVG